MKTLFFLTKPVSANISVEEMTFLMSHAEDNESYMEIVNEEADLKAVGFAPESFVIKSFITESLANMPEVSEMTPVTNMAQISNYAYGHNAYSRAVIVMAANISGLKNYRDPVLEKLFSSMGLSEKAAVACSKLLLSPEFREEFFRSDVEITTFEHHGKEYSLPKQLYTACCEKEQELAVQPEDDDLSSESADEGESEEFWENMRKQMEEANLQQQEQMKDN